MQSTDLGNKESGKIWHRKPSPATHDGIIVNIVHSTSEYHPKVLRFLNVAFDGSGDSFIAGDHQGNIYAFDLHGNRFALVQRTAQACTALAFDLRRKSEFLVALADYSIKCFDTVTRELVSWMRGHESSVSSISVHAAGRYAITTSSDTAQLWDLDTFQRKRKLNIRQSVGIQKVFFLPFSNTILSCFKDNSIFAWECDTLFCKYQLPAPPEGSSIVYKVFAVTRDGRILAAGGKSNHLHLWCLETTQLFRIIQMPTKVRAVRHLEFLPDSFDAGSNQNELSEGLNKKRLQILLKGYGEYPTKYRTLSALAHWSAIFSDTPFLPLLAFPFVKLFQNNQLICFEVVATLIINWCQHWFEYFPNPPINILSMIENVLAFHDKELLQHFIERDVTSQLYAWPLLETVFSEVLTREEWLRLFDNVFSNHPSFLLMAVVAYNTCSRAPLLNSTLKDDIEYFFHHRNNLDINVVIREVYRLMETTPADIHPRSMLDAFVALTKGQYPIFNQYPKFIVDYQTRERERIRNDELDFLRERLAAAKRELKMKEMRLQDAARRRFLKLQQDQREMELRRLEDEIERKVQMRDEEIAATAKDLEMKQLELESQKRHYEKDLTRSQDAIAKEIRDGADAHRRKVALEEHMFRNLLETSQLGNRTRRVVEDNLAKAEQACLDADWQIQALHKQKCDDQQRSEGYQEVATLLRKNRRREIEVLNAMMKEEAKKWKEAEEKELHLESVKRASALSDASRKWFLKQETSAVREHSGDLLCEAFSSRKTTEWNHTEHDLLKKVRNLRQRLTAQARDRCQLPHLLALSRKKAFSQASNVKSSANLRNSVVALLAKSKDYETDALPTALTRHLVAVFGLIMKSLLEKRSAHAQIFEFPLVVFLFQKCQRSLSISDLQTFARVVFILACPSVHQQAQWVAR
ncbi:TBC1 domain family member 31 [Microtus ochrogaster]|uniref:TBC1 domain family member 31 n=1 Tax=Microtus ochrogaster TaxID=79684 RepID=A0A8J6KSF3_MICOH|nr:TBC1 domain family member 31 [Microtus ochrogaster]